MSNSIVINSNRWACSDERIHYCIVAFLMKYNYLWVGGVYNTIYIILCALFINTLIFSLVCILYFSTFFCIFSHYLKVQMISLKWGSTGSLKNSQSCTSAYSMKRSAMYILLLPSRCNSSTHTSTTVMSIFLPLTKGCSTK